MGAGKRSICPESGIELLEVLQTCSDDDPTH